MEMIVCRWCSKETPTVGNYCMFCGKNPRPRRDMLWLGEKLEVADSANFIPFMEAIFHDKVEKTQSAKSVRWALSQLTQKRAQVLIRLFDLDNSGRRRTLTEVAKEVDISNTAIGYNRDAGLRFLRHHTRARVLLGHRPVPKEV